MYDQFSTVRDGQAAVDVHVFQGEAAEATANAFVGGFRLDGIPPAPAGEPKIEVRFTMDSSDLISVAASCGHQQANRTLDVTLRSELSEIMSPAQVDVVFLIDTSGSMEDELTGIQSRCMEFAEQVARDGVDCRLGLVDFDKPPGEVPYNYETFLPMPPEQFPDAISDLSVGRLGCCGCYVGDDATVEVFEALAEAFTDPKRSKVAVLVSDEVGNDAAAIGQIIRILKSADITLHVVGVDGSCHVRIAEETGGSFWDITDTRSVDFGELLSSIAAEVTDMTLRQPAPASH